MTQIDPATTGVLSRQEIAALLAAELPLVQHLPDPDAALQANGIDLSVEDIATFRGTGALTLDSANRRLPDTEPLAFDDDGLLTLPPGTYQVRFTETINLPADLMAYLRPRSSLLRSGVALHTAVWDAGYQGRGVALLVVYHAGGFTLQQFARVGQLVFHRLAAATDATYAGAYQHEGLRPS